MTISRTVATLVWLVSGWMTCAGAPSAAPSPRVIDIAKDPAFADIPCTRVTVDFDNASLAQATAAFTAATKLAVSVDTATIAQAGITLPPLSMHVHDVPLLQAVFQLARVTGSYPTELSATRLGLRAVAETTPDTVGAIAAAQPIGVWCVAGPFAMEISTLEKSGSITGAEGAAQSSLRAALFAEPTLRVLRYPKDLVVDQCLDDKGQAIGLGAGFGFGRPISASLPRSELSFPLKVSAKPGRTMALLRCAALFALPGKMETLETEEPEQGIVKTVGDLDVEILPITFAKAQPGVPVNSVHIRVCYRRGRMEPAKWEEMLPLFGLIVPTVLDVSNRPVMCYLAGQTNDGADTVNLTFDSFGHAPGQPQNNNEPGDPFRLKLEVPATVRTVNVPFEFTDLALP